MNAPAALDFAGRWQRIRARIDELGVDALLVTDLVDIRYLTGFTGSAGQLLVTATGSMVTTDGRYEEQIADQLAAAGLADSVDVVIGRPPAQDDAIAVAVESAAGRVGADASHLTWAAADAWRERLSGAELVPLADVFVPLRATKDAGEVQRIEAAARIADDALAACRQRLGEGCTELEFARELDHLMLTGGAEALSFETICASGPNAALPHARPSDRVIGEGDLVVLDFGAVVDGYHSDMTRSFAVGDAPPAAREMLEAVVAAQQAGVDAVGVGVACSAVDRACRSSLEAAGLADEFVHGTGHGVGLVIHEAPWVNATSDTVLHEGHVVTVEPGVYRPGFGGVRIEDTVLVTAEGARRLTASPKDTTVHPTAPDSPKG